MKSLRIARLACLASVQWSTLCIGVELLIRAYAYAGIQAILLVLTIWLLRHINRALQNAAASFPPPKTTPSSPLRRRTEP